MTAEVGTVTQPYKPVPPHRFPKGTSGNPGGRHKLIREAIETMEGTLPDIVRELAKLALHAESEKVRLAACSELLNRVIGKPKESVQVSVDSGEALTRALLSLSGGAPSIGAAPEVKTIDAQVEGAPLVQAPSNAEKVNAWVDGEVLGGENVGK